MLFALIMYLLGIEVRYRDGMFVKKNSFQAFLFAVRPNILTASIAPVLVGTTLAALDLGILGESFGWIQYILFILFAVAVQIYLNLLNDYFDYKSGNCKRSEFLGAPKACSMGWVDLPVMEKWIRLMILVSLLIGFPLVFYAGWYIIIVEILCLLFIYMYVYYLQYKGAGDAFILLFFGTILVNVMYYVETLEFSWNVLIISVGMGLVVDTLLLVSNYRDANQDLKNGKHTLATLIGKNRVPMLYLICGILGIISTLTLLQNGYWIPIALLFPYLILHILSFFKMKNIGQGRKLNNILDKSATNVFLFGFLLSLGLLIEKFIL